MVCIACQNEHNNNFCPNCGEKAGIRRITLTSVVKEAFSSITNMDKGFLYNLKTLALHPQQLIIDYIKGRRKGINNPITFLILSTTIYIILESFVELPISVPNNANVEKSRIFLAGKEAGHLMKTYLKYYWILSVFFLSSSTRLMFGKYNFIEHLTINSFILGFATLLGLFGLIVFKWHLLFNLFIYVIILIMLYRVFETKKDKIGTAVQALFAIFLFFIQLFIVIFLIGYLRTST